MKLEYAGSVEGAKVFKRGEWYFIKNHDGNWSKLLFDHTMGRRLAPTLEKELQGIETSEEPEHPVIPKIPGLDIEPL